MSHSNASPFPPTPGADVPDPSGIEHWVAPHETTVHCFRFAGVEYAYFSRTGDLFCPTEAAATALHAFEDGASLADGLALATEVHGAEAAADVSADFEALESLGAFVEEELPRPVTHELSKTSMLEHRPRNLMLFLTERCNLKCLYCYESITGLHDRGRVLKKAPGRQIIRDYLDRTRGRSEVKITMFGGEPLSNWPVFVELVLFAEQEAEVRGQRITFTTTSNLTLLDEEKADFLVAHGFTVMVSIDGDRETHDANRKDKRGRGTYERVAANLRMLIVKMRAAGLRLPRLRATWVAGRSDREEIRRHLAEFGVGDRLIAVGAASYDLDFSDLDGTTDEHRRQSEEEADRIVEAFLDGGELPEGMRKMLDKIDTEAAREAPHGEARQDLCGVCRNMLAATPQGDYYPCHRYVGMEGFKIGNAFEGGLDRERVGKYYDRVFDSFRQGCGSCWARHLCGGTCAWTLSGADGEVTTPRIETCSVIRRGYERMIHLYAVVRSDEALNRRVFEGGTTCEPTS